MHVFSTSPILAFKLLDAAIDIASRRLMMANLAIEEDVWCIDDSILSSPAARRAFSKGHILIRSGNIVGSI